MNCKWCCKPVATKEIHDGLPEGDCGDAYCWSDFNRAPGADRRDAMNPYRRFIRWLARRELEQAYQERAEAVNSAINWRGHYDDVTIVGRARGEALTALVNANAMTPAQISLAAVRLAKMDLPAEVRDLAIQELTMHIPSEGSDE